MGITYIFSDCRPRLSVYKPMRTLLAIVLEDYSYTKVKHIPYLVGRRERVRLRERR
jgi:hypothetical protein